MEENVKAQRVLQKGLADANFIEKQRLEAKEADLEAQREQVHAARRAVEQREDMGGDPS